jgi:hypothetical protein
MAGAEGACRRGARVKLAWSWQFGRRAQQLWRAAWAATLGARMEQKLHESSRVRLAEKIRRGVADDQGAGVRLKSRGDGEEAGAFAASDDGAVLIDQGAPAPRESASAAAIDPALMLATRRWYAKEFKLTSAFLGVSQLAVILNMAPSTIYTMMRAETFFITHRMMGASIKVWIDDLVAWHLSGAGVTPAHGQRAPRPCPTPRTDGAQVTGPRALSRAEVNEAVCKAADDGLRAAGIDPSTRRRRMSR